MISSSETGIEDELQSAVADASKTTDDIDSIYVKDIEAHLRTERSGTTA